MKKYNTSPFYEKKLSVLGYRLGNMDMYSVAFMHTCMENASIYQMVFDENIVFDRLLDSVKKAVSYFPLFECRQT